jgi:hypothetical protein
MSYQMPLSGRPRRWIAALYFRRPQDWKVVRLGAAQNLAAEFGRYRGMRTSAELRLRIRFISTRLVHGRTAGVSIVIPFARDIR